MNSISWKKVTGCSGIAFTVIFIASSVLVADSPALGDPASDFHEWIQNRETAIAITTWGGGLSLSLLFLLFASGLRSLFGSVDERSAGVWSRFSFAGAITMVAVGVSKAAFLAVLSLEDVRSSASDETIKILASFDGVVVGSLLPWCASAFLLGASVVILQSRLMANWLGWLGMLCVLMFVIGTLWLFTGVLENFFGILTSIGYLGFLIWTFGVAISLIRSDRSSVS